MFFFLKSNQSKPCCLLTLNTTEPHVTLSQLKYISKPMDGSKKRSIVWVRVMSYALGL